MPGVGRSENAMVKAVVVFCIESIGAKVYSLSRLTKCRLGVIIFGYISHQLLPKIC
jgi:hypothetical protein